MINAHKELKLNIRWHFQYNEVHYNHECYFESQQNLGIKAHINLIIHYKLISLIKYFDMKLHIIWWKDYKLKAECNYLHLCNYNLKYLLYHRNNLSISLNKENILICILSKNLHCSTSNYILDQYSKKSLNYFLYNLYNLILNLQFSTPLLKYINFLLFIWEQNKNRIKVYLNQKLSVGKISHQK